MGNQVIDHSCLCDGTLIKALNIEGQVSFPGWQHSMQISSHQCWGSSVLNPHERKMEALHLVFP